MFKTTGPQRKAFTLIEMMFGVFILGVGLVAVLQSITGTQLLNARNTSITIAANDAQYVLEQIKGLDYTTCIAQDFSGCYTFPAFTNLTAETVTHTNSVISNGLRQITITVHWTEKGQPKEFSLATYFTS